MGKQPDVVSLETVEGKGTDENLAQLTKYANGLFYRVYFTESFFVTINLKAKSDLNVDNKRF